MRKHITRSCILGIAVMAFLLALGNASQAQNPPLMRIAVLPFEECPACPYGISSNITDMVEEALFNTGHYTLIDRRTLLQVIREQGIGSTDLTDPKTVARVGKLVGVQTLVVGTINKFSIVNEGTSYNIQTYSATVRLTARAVKIETAEILAIASGDGLARGTNPPGFRREPATTGALKEAVKNLVDKLDAILQKKQ